MQPFCAAKIIFNLPRKNNTTLFATRMASLQELGYKEVPDTWGKRADELTDEEKQRFIIEDNLNFG